VDEVTSVYGSPVFCGDSIPRHYRDSVSRAIQAGSGSQACPVGDGFHVINPITLQSVGTFASTPITLDTLAGGSCSGAGPSLNPLANISSTCLFIPTTPNPTFGLPRTMLNPRQFQFAAKFTF
jgi:hypothetical protein